MGNNRDAVRRLAAAVMAAVCGLALTACSTGPLGLPTKGAVQTLAPAEQQTRRVYTNPEGPSEDAQPETIVKGFYDAMPAGVQSDGYRVAREFLTSAASSGWNGDSSAVVYGGTPEFRRRANTMSAPQGAESSLIVEVRLQAIGLLDSHGVYRPADSTKTRTISYTLIKTKGQWRISSLEDGVVISSADFEQVFRQVSVYQVAKSGKQLVPDVRWLGWRNWRTQAVNEVLGDVPGWLSGTVHEAELGAISLAVDSVPLKDSAVTVELTSGVTMLTSEERALLVHRIRLTLGDGNTGYTLKVTGDGVDYSDADSDVKLGTDQPNVGVYTLTGGHVVSLASSSPLRMGDVPGYDDAKGFVFSSSGGAVLRADGVVECLESDGTTCGAMFDGIPMKAITAGLGGEIWAVDEDGRALYVSHERKETKLQPEWLGNTDRIMAVAVSPEGARLALAVVGEGFNGVEMTGVSRDGSNTVDGLGKGVTTVSLTRNVGMLTFYNDLNLVYATLPQDDDNRQEAYRQVAPGPAQVQRLPDVTVAAMASGQISLYRRLAVLDTQGTVRSVSGSLDGSWSIADSQVTALGAQ
ncbi:LpqB family beta-propeller domain-containing protein [Bifidobacterium miconisargentati]|uniref:LpqB family beta-propeller domain-containing protein n=1 Tax=Bifidobacterium miconisargentati TaxID=2834437 RepID=UPI001BDDC257|nr:LpqB family beta-propeller domain-containing protein [Bifidobacterium miconisargentati]MBW3089534.1 hypothetical protein [Bifidobacterium miconisargentati]